MILDWLDRRTGYRGIANAMLFEHIPGGARWRYVWGSTLVFTFTVQIITGFFLWMNYSPSSQTAWESVYYIQHHLTAGWLLRGIHHYTAQMMVVLLALHMMQVVIDGAYRAPREFNFWIGLALLLLTLALALTGYLLPWDQRGYWSTKVATSIMGVAPVIGPALQRLAVGGPDYGHHTLTRFFALHAGLLPLLMIGLTAIHVYLFRRHGLTYKQPRKKPDAHFWVDQVLKDAIACLAVVATVLFLVFWPWVRHGGQVSSLGQLGAELSAPADPSNAFSAARPEWYFLFLFQFLKFEQFAGQNEVIGAVVIPGAIFLVLALMPLIGRWRAGHWFNVWFIVALFIGIALMTTTALAQDSGWPHVSTPLIGGLSYGFGVAWLIVLAAAMAAAMVMLLIGKTARAYRRALIGLAVLIVVTVVGVAWSLAPGTALLGSRPAFGVSAGAQQWLMAGLLVMGALIVTIGLLREPYAMPEVAGFSRRWQWLHRLRLLGLLLTAGAVVVFVGTNLLKEAGNPAYAEAVTEARDHADRVVVLASSPDGIPPSGAVSLLRLDPKTQGPKYFARNCASCHRYNGHDGTGALIDPAASTDARTLHAGAVRAASADSIQLAEDASADDGAYYWWTVRIMSGAGANQYRHIIAYDGKTRTARIDPAHPWEVAPDSTSRYAIMSSQSAADLGGFATRAWIDGILDARKIVSPHYYGNTAFVDGEMVDFVQSTVPRWSEEKKQDLSKVVAAVSAEAALPVRAQAPADPQAVKEGYDLLPAIRMGCAKCHTVPGGQEQEGAPTLVGYGSRQWLVDFIKNPSHPKFYDKENDRMPAYGEKGILDDETIGMIADWLRGDWYEPGESHRPRPHLDLPPAPVVPPASPTTKPSADGEAAVLRAGPAQETSADTWFTTAAPAPQSRPARSQTRPAAPLAAGKVDFTTYVKPLLEAHCTKCHGADRPTNGYNITTRASAFTPGDSEQQPIIAGNARASYLYQLITAKDEKHRMPQKAKPLAPNQTALLQRWIDQGAIWPANLTLETPKKEE